MATPATEPRGIMRLHAKSMIQLPRARSSELMPASDVSIRTKEVIIRNDIFVKLLAKHTGNSTDAVAEVTKRAFYMDSTRAKEFGVVNKMLWRGQEHIWQMLPFQRNGTRMLELKHLIQFSFFYQITR